MRDPEVRLPVLRECVRNSRTEAQFESRKAILNRILKHLQDSGNDMDYFYANLVRDWPAFCAYELNTLEGGVPVFYAPWQLEAYYETQDSNNNWFTCARQVGKTVLEATLALEKCLTEWNHSVLAIAPTQEQLVVRDNFKHFVDQSDFIKNEYVRDGTNAKKLIKFGANGSSFRPINLSGDFKRGRTGSTVMVDEFQLLSESEFGDIVEPMLSASYGSQERELYRFMTPSYLYRDDLNQLWQKSKGGESVRTFHIDIWQAVYEGIKYVSAEHGAGSLQQIFANNGINCPFVKQGVPCPDHLPQWFSDDSGELPRCGCNPSSSDTFKKEYMAEFPRQEGRFFPAERLHAVNTGDHLLDFAEIRSLETPVSMGVDIGGLTDDTQIVFNQYWRDGNDYRMRTVGHYHIEPVGGGGTAPDSNQITRKIKWAYHQVKPDIVVPDITNQKREARKLVEGDYAIPSSVIVDTSAKKKHGLDGLWLTGQLKADIVTNHRDLIVSQNLKVNGGNKDLWESYFKQHSAVRQRDTRSDTSYPRFDTPNTDHLFDAACYASAAVLFDATSTSHDFEFVER